MDKLEEVEIKQGASWVSTEFKGDITFTNTLKSNDVMKINSVKEGVVEFQLSLDYILKKENFIKMPINEFIVKYRPHPRFSTGTKLLLFLMIAASIPVIQYGITFAMSATSPSKSNDRETVYYSEADCRQDASQIAYRVKANILEGHSDVFYEIDLTNYIKNGCSNSYIMDVVNKTL